jgi:quinol monooxygenase YgiN
MKHAIPILLVAALNASAQNQPAKSPPTLVDRLEKILKGQDRPFAIIIQIYISPESAERFEKVAAHVARASRNDAGCQLYEFHRDLEKPGHYTLVEHWTGLAALKAHLEQAHTKQIQAVFAELATTPRTAEIFVPLPTSDLPK